MITIIVVSNQNTDVEREITVIETNIHTQSDEWTNNINSLKVDLEVIKKVRRFSLSTLK